jgi:hypothetical protein
MWREHSSNKARLSHQESTNATQHVGYMTSRVCTFMRMFIAAHTLARLLPLCTLQWLWYAVVGSTGGIILMCTAEALQPDMIGCLLVGVSCLQTHPMAAHGRRHDSRGAAEQRWLDDWFKSTPQCASCLHSVSFSMRLVTHLHIALTHPRATDTFTA